MADYKSNDVDIAKSIFSKQYSKSPKQIKNKDIPSFTIKQEVGTNQIYSVVNNITNESGKYQSIGKLDKIKLKVNDTIIVSDKIQYFYKGLYRGKKDGNLLLLIDNKEKEIPKIVRFIFKEYKED